MKGCDTPPTSDIRFLTPTPTGNKEYVSPGPVSLDCRTTRDVKSVLWIRNNSDGESKIINSTEFRDLLPFAGSPKVAKLTDYPPEDKFPFSYQCIAFGKCCDEIHSMPATVCKLILLLFVTFVRSLGGFAPAHYFNIVELVLSSQLLYRVSQKKRNPHKLIMYSLR